MIYAIAVPTRGDPYGLLRPSDKATILWSGRRETYFLRDQGCLNEEDVAQASICQGMDISMDSVLSRKLCSIVACGASVQFGFDAANMCDQGRGAVSDAPRNRCFDTLCTESRIVPHIVVWPTGGASFLFGSDAANMYDRGCNEPVLFCWRCLCTYMSVARRTRRSLSNCLLLLKLLPCLMLL